MEVITIETAAYRDLMLKLNTLCEYIRFFSQARDEAKAKAEKDEAWLDSNEVCKKLNISSRTLYRMKKERRISYSIFRGQCRFKYSDVEKLLHERVIVSNPATPDELRQPLKVGSNG